MSEKYKRKDFHYQEAKKHGVRSRAYYKLQELDQKYSLIKRGYKVLDLGAWPGSWIQYVVQKIGPKGLAVGIDLDQIEPFQEENVQLVQGDLFQEENIDKLLDINPAKYDLVLSDMSPKLTGIKESDQAKSAALAELAIYCASQVLRPGGNLAIKVFKSGDTDLVINQHRKFFKKLVRAGLKSTRKTSNEFYIVGFGFDADKYIESL